MECKLLDKENIHLMEKFVDDENTNYEKAGGVNNADDEIVYVYK